MSLIVLWTFVFIAVLNVTIISIWLIQDLLDKFDFKKEPAVWYWRCSHCPFFVRSDDLNILELINKHVETHQNG